MDITIEFWRMLSAYVFVIIVLLIFQWRSINRKLQLTVATFRMTIQLFLAGYVLVYLFDHPHPLLILTVLVLMQAFAIYNVFKRVDRELSPQLKRTVAVAMTVGSFSALFYFLIIVLNVSPLDPKVLIPIAGMMIGNAMTGVTLGVQSLLDSFSSERDQIEGMLMLGATPKAAVKPFVDRAFDAAVLPTINSMVGMGIVFLPGMMTGQILAGMSPTTAIQYQLTIMLGILGGVAMSVILFTQLGYKAFFTKEAQLKPRLKKKK